ncbi:hypothetical protein K7711_46710 [Nocardia sp. CA2R105]|nr:hypothetical protein [Nocardia coffeae]MBY8864025.1 hypothetical protein [Nocardia coffeae]
MDAPNDERLHELFEQDASLLEMLDHLSMREDVPLTGMRFLWIFQMELGISFVESRKILACFDPSMRVVDRFDQLPDLFSSGSP